MSWEIGLSTPTVPNRGFTLWIWSVTMIILAGLFVVTRLAIRFHNRRLGADDWTIFASMVRDRQFHELHILTDVCTE